MGATLRAVGLIFETPAKILTKQIHAPVQSIHFSVWTNNQHRYSRQAFPHQAIWLQNHYHHCQDNINNGPVITRNMLSSNTATVASAAGDSAIASSDTKLCASETLRERSDEELDVDKTNLESIEFQNEEEKKTKEVLLNKKGQVLSNRAQRRLTRIELIKNRASSKKEKKLRKLSDPNADKNAGFGEEIFSETEYYFENGLRKVYPYYYTFNAFAKRRWLGRRLIDVFSEEFRAENKEFYEEAIEAGTVKVNGAPITRDYTLKEGDLVQNTIHRHENPVTDRDVRIIHEDDDVLVVDKPSSIPCHPCGRYRFNSIVFILGKEMGQPNLRNIYRLDRLTSGVMVCGKTAKRTAELERHVLNREVEKEYVCRVVGEFPDGRISVEEPMDILSNRVAVWKVSASGKPSQTFFEKMSYNGTSSVVKCFPKTGRTHQIRVHLQYLGFPIVNDPIYNSEAFGPLRGKGGNYGKTEQEVIADIEKVHNVGEWEDGENPLYELKMERRKVSQEDRKLSSTEDGANVAATEDCGPTEGCRGDHTGSGSGSIPLHERSVTDHPVKMTDSSAEEACDEPSAKRLKVTEKSARPGFDFEKWEPDERCRACRRRYLDPSPDNLTMYLHALRYKGPDWDYSTELPHWAEADFVEEGMVT